MNIISKLKRAARIGLVFGVFSAAIAGAGLIANHTAPVAANGTCDKVNVIYCGLSGTTTSANIIALKTAYDNNTSEHTPPYHDVKAIFYFVGADQNLIDTMNTSNTVAGLVYRNGNVTVNGVVIATNAKVAARFSVPGAVAIPGTNAYLRTTTSSFAFNSEPAIIRLDANGNMLFAAITACGNAVQATPVPRPSYTITKEVAVKGTSAYAKSVNVNPGTHVVYRITVASTGNAAVSNLTVKDSLPAHVEYVDNTLQRDNVAASTTFFSTGVQIASLKNGTSTVFSFEAIVGPNDTVAVCSDESLNNVGSMTATGLPGEDSTATVSKTCLPKPTPTPPTNTPPTNTPPTNTPAVPAYACVSLSAFSISRTNFNYTATSTATNGATVKAYNFNFGDGATQSVTTNGTTTMLEHAYSTPGSYNSSVSVTVAVPGSSDSTVTSTACATSVNVTQLPAAAECTDLKLLQAAGNPRNVTATVTYSVRNGASLSGVSFNWSDGNVSNNGLITSAQHTYQGDGKFNIVATLSFVNGSTNLPSSTCQVPISFSTIPPVVPPVVPTTLVNTGPGSVASMFAGVTAIGTVGYRFFLGRRLNRA